MLMQKQEVYLKEIDEKKRQLREVVGDSYRCVSLDDTVQARFLAWEITRLVVQGFDIEC